jgi:hypothetical protein
VQVDNMSACVFSLEELKIYTQKVAMYTVGCYMLNHHKREEPQIGACTALGFLWVSMKYYLTWMIIFRRTISI